jgi:hypothetical protein
LCHRVHRLSLERLYLHFKLGLDHNNVQWIQNRRLVFFIFSFFVESLLLISYMS